MQPYPTCVLHDGVKETLTELHVSFWIVKGRSFTKRIIHQCHLCRRHEGQLYSAPPTLPLPTFRVKEVLIYGHGLHWARL